MEYNQGVGFDDTFKKWQSYLTPAQSTGAVEYADCISADGYDSHNECPG